MPWNQFSETKLIELEDKILSVVKTAYKKWFVPIKTSLGSKEQIWTLCANEHNKNTPLVLLHGFGAGIGFWCFNLDALAQNRPVYAIDILGFGRSSRPKFNRDSVAAERELVDSIEEWRKEVKLSKFILLGHSMGGFLAASYALTYPDNVKHLILADPWGFQAEKNPEKNFPLWVKSLAVLLYPLTVFNPLASVRAAGPFGTWLINKMRSDITSKFTDVVSDRTVISEYIYHCNAQNPTGETAFHNMCVGFGWAKNPMTTRISSLKSELPITFIYGAKTWMDSSMGNRVKNMRPNSFVDVQFVENAGHHLYADNPNMFNECAIQACTNCDNKICIKKCAAQNGVNELMDIEDDETETIIGQKKST